MHRSTMLRMEWFINNYIKEDGKKVLDVGSYNVNGSYRDLFFGKNVEYVGLDIEEGPNVDVIMDEPYSWSSIEDESFDYIISGQAFEHIEYPWLTIKEIYKKLKSGGVICIIAPNSTPEHRYPFDCYRFFSDGLSALAKWAGFNVLNVTVAGIPEKTVSPEWYSDHNDVCLIAMKPKEGMVLNDIPKLKYERRLNWRTDQRLCCEFLSNWIEKGNMGELFKEYVKQENHKKVYIYGQNSVGKILYNVLKQIAGVETELIGPKSMEEKDTDAGVDLSDLTNLEEDSIMFIAMLDYCRDFKYYLDSLYTEMPKYYVDEVLDFIRFERFFKEYEKVYLYGAGKFGEKYLELLMRYGLKPDGFVVSNGKKREQSIGKYEILELEELQYSDKVGIIITVNNNLEKEIESSLIKKGYTNYIIGCEYLNIFL